MGAGIDGDALERSKAPSGQRIDFFDAVDFVAKEFHADGPIFLVAWENLEYVSPHPEDAPVKVFVVALVLNFYQFTKHLLACNFHVHIELQEHFPVGFR